MNKDEDADEEADDDAEEDADDEAELLELMPVPVLVELLDPNGAPLRWIPAASANGRDRKNGRERRTERMLPHMEARRALRRP